jgi:hypothetical protein
MFRRSSLTSDVTTTAILAESAPRTRRLTLRCSGPGEHKVQGRGRSAFSALNLGAPRASAAVAGR